MNIHENTALLDAFLDGELTLEEQSAVEAHLADCADCRAYVDDGLAIRAAFPTEETAELPADLKEHVMAAVANAPQSRPKKQPWGKLMAAAACLAVIVAVQHIGSGAVGTDSSANATAAYAADCAVEESIPMERSVETPGSAAAQNEDTNGAEEDRVSPSTESERETDSAAAVLSNTTDETAAKDAVELPVVQITEADVGDLLADFTPEETVPGCARYLLTRDEFEELAAQLAERDITLEDPSGSEQLWLEVCSE